ncbi:hypothetical protein [Bacillus cereus]|uniref:hypothetical protein n=1 Tax=Bacillus cereus TaxID=1396 RepID=UPI000DEED48E|nr:hypothetical protein [Bacillus cereus]MDA1764242.1 hypothetical protein [Bacillus cereus]MDF3554506.1 hypothetical protein [Bacillus cereus]RCL13787.1 hypothetical protein BLO02_024665 [Bacillus cereus]
MYNELEISDINVTSPRLRKPNIEDGEQSKYVVIKISVRNNSKNTYQVISSLRGLRYDSANRILLIMLSEPESDNNVPVYFKKLDPKIRVILPEETIILKVSVPLIINEIQLSEGSGLGLNILKLDISDLQQISCTISYDIYSVQSKSDDTVEKASALIEWSQNVKKTFEQKIPNELRYP